ncbi:MAG: THUMP domain-containing class I SAM-dependent RNA methyltransferase [Bacteroidota bacterium]
MVGGNFDMVARTFQGLETILAAELEQLKVENIRIRKRAVQFTGDSKALYKTNYCCRTALNILVPIHEFTATGPETLYNYLLKFQWDQFMDIKKSFLVKVTINSKYFKHSQYVVHKIKDAISDYFTRKTMLRPSVDRINPDIVFNLHVSHDKCTLSLDSSGEPLFKRGYRVESGEAPLNEILAAGMVLISGWDGTGDLFDLMCGSGTILAEAGLIGMNVAPGSFRQNFGFMKWKDYDPDQFDIIKEESEKKINNNPSFTLHGNDIHRHVIRKAQKNMNRAGLAKFVKLSTGSAFDFIPKVQHGKLIMNPPYGERLKDDDVHFLYRQIGTALKTHFTGFEAWLLSSNKDAIKHVGLKPSFNTVLYNGPLECKFLKYELYEGSKKSKDIKK